MFESNPVLVQFWRGDSIESAHRGAWVLADSSGIVHANASDPTQLVFARSSTKSFQALPLVESGAADAFGLPTQSLAIALASHSGEPQHAAATLQTLKLIGLTPQDLLCGPQAPMGSARDTTGTRILNNCSGKHAGFLAISQHLGVDPADYLDPDGTVQTLVRDALASITGADPTQACVATDGCGAPTFRLPLLALATGIARVANAEQASHSALLGLTTERSEACQRLVRAARLHPELVAGSTKRICSDLLKVTSGRLFSKIGAEGVYLVGVVGSDRGIAIKIDDGNIRAIYPLLMELLQRFGFINNAEAEQLSRWSDPTVRNWDDQVVGHIAVTGPA